MAYTDASTADEGRIRQRGRRATLSTLEMGAIALVIVGLFLAATVGSTPAVEVPLAAVRVGTGQTLWNLAAAHPVDGLTTAQTVELIAETNRLDGGSLQAGRTLMVPAGEHADAVAMR